MTAIEEARQTVADRFIGICARAIIRGDWDAGKLVQEELARINLRRTMTKHASQ